MKKILFALTLCFVMVSFWGCDRQDNEYEIQSDYAIESYDNEQVLTPDKTQSDAFAVSDKKYSYDGKDLIIMQIKNQTNDPYSITINGQFLDENGNVLQTETKSFDQFAAGYENHFLFQPDIRFADFRYTIDFKKYKGDIYVNEIDVWFEGLTELLVHIDELIEQGDHNRHPAIMARFGYRSKASVSLCPIGTWIVYGNNDKIVYICPIGTWLYAGSEKDQFSSWRIHYTTDEKLTWPDHLKGELKAVYALEEILLESQE
ncbi:MAG: hypothetical protein IJD82_01105 [Clostridia bacterium]|nr:hypothetical protein [Clostridia bacterium]